MAENNDVEVQFGADVSAIEESANRMRFFLEGLSSPLRGLRDSLGEVAEAFLAAFAVEKIAEFAKEMGELGEETDRTAAILGITTKEVGLLTGTALLTGTSVEGLTAAIERMQGRMGVANANVSPLGQALAALNIPFKEFQQLGTNGQLEIIAEKFSRMADGPNKTAIAYNLLGRSGAQLIPMLNEGKEGIERMNEEIEKTNSLLAPELSKQLHEMADDFNLLGLAIKGDAITGFEAFIPAVRGGVQLLIDLAENFSAAMKSGGLFADTMYLIADACKVVVTAIAAIVIGLEATWSAAVVIVDDLGHLFIQLGKAIWDALHFNFSAAVDDIKDIGAKATDTMKTYLDTITNLSSQYKHQLDTIWGGGSSGGETKPNLPKAPTMPDLTGGLNAAMKEIEGEIKLAQQALATKKELYQLEADTFQITQQQKYHMLEQATEQEYQTELGLLNKELGLGNLKVEQRAAILAKIKELEEKHKTEMLKLDAQAIAQEQKLYQEYFGQLQSSFNGQLRGLLAGTTSFSQAMKSVFADMIIFVIEQIEKMVFNWIAGQLAMTTASTTGAAARVAAEQGASASSLAANLTKVVSGIMSSVGEVFAGVSAFFSPFLGPAAPAAAAPVAAGVQSTAMAMIPALDVGTAYVPATMQATLHQGEMVVPATFAQGIREMMTGSSKASGGGGDTFYVQAVDAASFEALLMRNGPAVGRAMRKHAREGRG